LDHKKEQPALSNTCPHKSSFFVVDKTFWYFFVVVYSRSYSPYMYCLTKWIFFAGFNYVLSLRRLDFTRVDTWKSWWFMPFILLLQKILLLSKAYQHVDDIDLFIGGVMEEPCPGRFKQKFLGRDELQITVI
jgi:hypothetical protein